MTPNEALAHLSQVQHNSQNLADPEAAVNQAEMAFKKSVADALNELKTASAPVAAAQISPVAPAALEEIEPEIHAIQEQSSDTTVAPPHAHPTAPTVALPSIEPTNTSI